MTAPRQVLSGNTYLLTRRCVRREFLLRPSPVANAIFTYALALAARKTGVLLHAFCVLSNHVHLVLTDPDARLPEFMRQLNANVARAMNAALGRSGSFWDERHYSAVVLATPEAIVNSAAYALANPVTAGLVRLATEWPGVWSDPSRLGGAPSLVERPSVFFRAKGKPDRVELSLVPPPDFTAEQFRADVIAALAERERDAVVAAHAAGRSFLGVRRVLEQETTARAARKEARGQLSPTVAALDRETRLEVLARIADFVARYREARSRFIAGFRDVVFPAGTYRLRVSYGVLCEAA